MKIGNKNFDLNKTNVMGIINITPDSFSDGSKYNSIDKALYRSTEMIKEGVDIIDIGGESTRPGHIKISEEEEIERVVPVIKAIKDNLDIVVSVDTYKPNVARESIISGADMLNDVWGLKYDKEMLKVLKEFQVPYCLMHNRKEINYNNFLDDVLNDIAESLKLLDEISYSKDKIIIDPGIGFAKTYEQNIEMLRNLEILHKFNLPILLGTSRKSVIGLTLNLEVDNRLEGTIATTCLAVQKKCSFVRVHDVKENLRAIKMYERLVR